MKNHERKESQQKKNISVLTIIVWFFATSASLYGIYEILDYFNINFFILLVTPLTIFILVSVVIVMIRVIIFYKDRNIDPLQKETQVNSPEENDSIIEMLKDAEAHARWDEIIKIGTAISDVLWFTGRRNLRIKIAHFVEIASTQVNDYYILASILIEDLGNTTLAIGDANKSIGYITRGIRIAENNNYTTLIIRGYRNLANCYSYKHDVVNAEKNLKKAENKIPDLTNELDQLYAKGSIEYAQSKICRNKSDYKAAINALNKVIEHYEELEEKYPKEKGNVNDRLVKVYREKGVVYLLDSQPKTIDLAYESLQKGLRLAQINSKYIDIIRCCSLMAKIKLEQGALDTADGLLKIAKQYVDKIDSEDTLNEYYDAVRNLQKFNEEQ